MYALLSRGLRVNSYQSEMWSQNFLYKKENNLNLWHIGRFHPSLKLSWCLNSHAQRLEGYLNVEGQVLQIHISMGSLLSSDQFRTISKNGACPLPLTPASRISDQEWFSPVVFRQTWWRLEKSPGRCPLTLSEHNPCQKSRCPTNVVDLEVELTS